MNDFETALHEKLVDLADLILARYDPCRISGGKCAARHPLYCCSYKIRFKREDPQDRRCLYLGKNGCTMPNIECKVWLCKSARLSADPQAVETLKKIEEIARDYGLAR